MENQIKNLRALIEKTEGDERKAYEDQLVEAIKADAEQKATDQVEKRVREELAKASSVDVSEPKIEVGPNMGSEYKGLKTKRVIAAIAQKGRGRGLDAYLKSDDDAAEFLARHFIDMTEKAMNPREKANELITTTTTLGGYLTPIEQESSILSAVRYSSIALRDATVVPMMSDVMTWPVGNGDDDVTIETSELAITQSTPTYGVATLTSKRHSGYVPVSWELEADNNVGLVAFLADGFMEKLGTKIDSAVFCGAGSLVDGSGVLAGGYGASAVMVTASTNFSSVYTAAAIATEAALLPRYRSGAKVYCGYASAAPYLKQLLFGTDQNLYSWPDNKFMGYPVELLETSVATGASAPVFVLGNLKNFIIGSRLMNMGLKRIENKTGTTDYVFYTRLAYSNPLASTFSACVTGAGS